MKENSDWDGLSATMRKIYKSEAVQIRILQIDVAGNGEQNAGPSMLECFTDPVYRSATWMGVLMMVFQQLSGINVLIFYSSNIFEDVGKPGPVGVAIVNSANLVGAILGGLMLSRYGRKTLIVFWSFIMSIFMILMGVAYNEAQLCHDPTNCTAANFELLCTVGFILCFEFALGTIPWLYMAEIMTNKGMSAGVVTNQVFTLIISFSSNFLLTKMDGWVFVMFGVISLLVSTFF